MAKYDIGDVVRVSASFTNLSGSLIDPTSASMAFETATSSITYVYSSDDELVRSATGIYYVDLTITESGRWNVRWSSSGTGQATEESHFDVRTRVV